MFNEGVWLLLILIAITWIGWPLWQIADDMRALRKKAEGVRK